MGILIRLVKKVLSIVNESRESQLLETRSRLTGIIERCDGWKKETFLRDENRVEELLKVTQRAKALLQRQDFGKEDIYGAIRLNREYLSKVRGYIAG